MAAALTARHYGDEVAQREREEFERVFKQKELPDDMPEHTLAAGEHVAADRVRGAFGLSGGEAKRLLVLEIGFLEDLMDDISGDESFG